MAQPLRIPCPTVEDVPPADRLAALATFERHVVLELPATPANEAEKERLVARLARALPDHRVFDSGGRSAADAAPTTWVTVLRVISEADVLANADAIVDAAREFRSIATALMTLLARGRHPRGSPDRGELGDGWEYAFHGLECAFRNRVTGQYVDVRLQFGNEFGALDPWFFAGFVRTTPGLEAVARLFRDDFHDAARALDVLRRHGRLREISAGGRSGLVAPD